MSESKVVDNDRGWREFFRRSKDLRGGMHLKVGVLGDSERGGLHKKKPNGKASPLTTAEIAAVNEYGTQDGRIPPRPAFRETFDKLREELLQDFAKVLGKALDGELPIEHGFDALGMKLAAAIRKRITQGDEVPPPNAPSTRRKKERHGTTTGAKTEGWGVRTLVDTGAEIAAISWALVRDGKQAAAKYLSGAGGGSRSGPGAGRDEHGRFVKRK